MSYTDTIKLARILAKKQKEGGPSTSLDYETRPMAFAYIENVVPYDTEYDPASLIEKYNLLIQIDRMMQDTSHRIGDEHWQHMENLIKSKITLLLHNMKKNEDAQTKLDINVPHKLTAQEMMDAHATLRSIMQSNPNQNRAGKIEWINTLVDNCIHFDYSKGNFPPGEGELMRAAQAALHYLDRNKDRKNVDPTPNVA